MVVFFFPGRYPRRSATDQIYIPSDDFSSSMLSGRHAKTLLELSIIGMYEPFLLGNARWTRGEKEEWE